MPGAEGDRVKNHRTQNGGGPLERGDHGIYVDRS
jgi:hypothetical protein